ncbi:hypothetical protein BDY17DRAFT_299226 [Neohortaea acidophila]|uniref:DUF7728 domain-containing protein n=1 Tax=Neohortaea acidophila TaxID=245834 RepID=A0A6A6PT16_9PEZI|nr:uncharacterized protein BDY17DRAFT_299226 [Neohortaea acidophila]KAF2482824.1 hypothetical protein BDY17DRAFT_299226 [Neohortaea acidophila]
MGMTARILAAAVWTTAAAGFLLPPGLSSASNDDLLPPALSREHLVHIPCPSCSLLPVASDIDGASDWQRMQATIDAILIDIRTTADLQHLEIAGEIVYPWDARSLDDLRRPHATQISYSTSAELPIEITSLGMKFPDPEPASDDGDLTTTFEYQILALGEQDMPDMPVIMIKVLQMKNGELYILDVSSEAAPASEDDDPASFFVPELDTPAPPPAPACTNILCSLRDFVKSRLGSMHKPACPGRKSRVHSVGAEESKVEAHPHPFHHDHHHHHPPPPPSLGHIHIPAPQSPHERHHHHHPHGGSHPWGPPEEHGRHGHFFLHVAIGSIITTLIPILAGIFVGLLISYIALGFARVVGCVYHSTFRGQGSEDDESDDLEKLMPKETEAECPPAYEHAPAYVELEAAESK